MCIRDRFHSMKPAEYLDVGKWSPPECTRVGDATLFEPSPPQSRRRTTREQLPALGPEAKKLERGSRGAMHVSGFDSMMFSHQGRSDFKPPHSSRRMSARSMPEPHDMRAMQALMVHRFAPQIGTPASLHGDPPPLVPCPRPSIQRSASDVIHDPWRTSPNFETYSELMRDNGAPRLGCSAPIMEEEDGPEEEKLVESDVGEDWTRQVPALRLKPR
eukprot:TRINITY_DN1067_c0_g1_i17.p1 TRINITY_DN1067_c0_g1~~TRINITY_DN1067_c0_g1_i17.p1  ORF type:complete len:216 (-),score=30.77 TRINITY_DN1067_c0_g1_i17:79-726(-)